VGFAAIFAFPHTPSKDDVAMIQHHHGWLGKLSGADVG
jgi:hypothetical protein